MKRTAQWVMGAIFVMTLLISSCLAQSDSASLGDTARATRKEKQSQAAPPKVFDNDNLPKEEHISVVGGSAVTNDGAQPAKNADAAAGSDKEAQAKQQDTNDMAIKPDTSPEERQRIYGEWRKQIADQKDTLTLLQRELDVLQREYRLRAAAMYADVGNRLRNQSDWDKEDRDYKDKIEAKQKDVDRAKQQMSDLQDQARKAGVPSGALE